MRITADRLRDWYNKNYGERDYGDWRFQFLNNHRMIGIAFKQFANRNGKLWLSGVTYFARSKENPENFVLYTNGCKVLEFFKDGGVQIDRGQRWGRQRLNWHLKDANIFGYGTGEMWAFGMRFRFINKLIYYPDNALKTIKGYLLLRRLGGEND